MRAAKIPDPYKVFGTFFNLKLDEPVEDDFYVYLIKWMRAPHIKYDNEKLSSYFSEEYLNEHSYYGDLGNDGEYFICESKDDFKNLKGDNTYQYSFPGMYCPWEIDYDQKRILFNTDALAALSSFECMIWLRYMIGHFFEPNGYILNGSISFGLEERKFSIENNKIIEI